MTCWALLIIERRHKFYLGKIHSIPLRKRPFENSPALTWTLDLEMFILANKMLVVLIIYIFIFPGALGKLN